MCSNCTFSPRTKSLLEQEAGSRCGFPSCRTRASGPSNSSASGLAQLGQAAHITAASPLGKRYDESITHAERAGEGNGIWMCSNHAKLIDSDEDRFPTHLLHRWKRQLRHLRQWALDRGLDFVPQMELIRLVRRVPLSAGGTNEQVAEFVADFMDDIGTKFVWGEEIAEAARQTLTELVFNEHQHGCATWFRLDSRGFAVRLTTDGQSFPLSQLRGAPEGNGGQLTVSVFASSYSDTHVLSYRRTSAGNQRYLITDIRRTPQAHNPCAATSEQLSSTPPEGLSLRFAHCPEIHIYPSRRVWTVSAGGRDLGRLEVLKPGTSVVLHVPPGPMVDALIARHAELSIRVAGTDPKLHH